MEVNRFVFLFCYFRRVFDFSFFVRLGCVIVGKLLYFFELFFFFLLIGFVEVVYYVVYLVGVLKFFIVGGYDFYYLDVEIEV